ncbi:bifunctional phosphopantothenoylcysteine decarboxylase/phosphopantothenate--cysteine ligase CoaBC [Paenibacillus sp. BSR1-1]|uniref:bifunctional phosphopantothenoylcysteine decarboxylase/phosphopantothenate--cysteine ligase CoaBC n=1 Tax=Paenibacillus sp. BSR1-1 TaxID=3020845 RepID=UPI0025B0EAA3|nr:bifunctional phosphopantothenoylcysteine decarboxylase/phosphopantothenate--cysteine ligase CoaBC [Paenibacillus sp. BSR1-1]MDN3014808.1 bifunctional phosphopantothenoylcysteine decarboxylase/phosphopantothenate--cysteine ligase CoaBC [Paenibacillus sp. BSR1-1]
MLNNKKILLCVSGGIAVYKAAALTSKLVQAGAQVKVILSESASKFVTPLTFQALSRNEVYTDTFDEKNPQVIAHIDLADWADLILVAPATANTIAKLAGGIADNMITTTLLAATAPVWIAPAMNVHMYDHPAVKKNLSILAEFGYQFIEPSEGYLACGYIGKGRLEEPEKIVELVQAFFTNEEVKPLKGKTVIVTAGPTREKIDPVRFISNHSSGKMGYALAEEAKKQGAEVILVSGPVQIPAPHGINVVRVESAEEMYDAVLSFYERADVVIKTAAVADYRPKNAFDYKVKKKPGDSNIELERTKDILLELGQRKKHQLLIGFAAETDNVEEYARKKLAAKNADMIVANNVKKEGAGFGTDTNIVTLFKRDGSVSALPMMSKTAVAEKIIEETTSLLKDMK